MKHPHLRYASYVARHKWFVFVAGRKTGAPLWRLVIHGQPSDAARQDRFNAAWLHHQHRNPHHWQHYVLREDDGDTIALEMPEPLVREMVADWMGVGRRLVVRPKRAPPSPTPSDAQDRARPHR